jgi:vacuolar-type H+-ATPase subunit F/Vma7
MALFDDMTPEAKQAAADEQSREAMEAMRVFTEGADHADVIAICDELTKQANELAELLDLAPSPTVLAMLVGAGLQRTEVIEARDRQGEATENN